MKCCCAGDCPPWSGTPGTLRQVTASGTSVDEIPPKANQLTQTMTAKEIKQKHSGM
jgi:hypothetical protein